MVMINGIVASRVKTPHVTNKAHRHSLKITKARLVGDPTPNGSGNRSIRVLHFDHLGSPCAINMVEPIAIRNTPIPNFSIPYSVKNPRVFNKIFLHPCAEPFILLNRDTVSN